MKFAGERRALAAIVFVFYAIAYLGLALWSAQPAMSPALYALGGVYGLAFFALVAGYFWARWYAIGVGIYGVIVGALGMWQVGAEPIIVFIGATHVAAVVMLWGAGMSVGFDGKTQWREKFHMDENAVQRLGRSVIRAGVSLPIVLLYALAPKQPAEAALGVAALLCAGLGMRAIVKMKSWGVLALAASGVMMVSMGVAHTEMFPMLSGALLLSAAAPFALPMLRYVRA